MKNDTISQTDKYIKSIITVLIIITSYFFILNFIFPKYFMPLIGHHSDMIDYAYDSNGLGLFDFIKQPRPIAMAILGAVSFSNYKVTMLFLVILTLVNIYLIIGVADMIFSLKRENYIFKAVYCILIFCHPGFYINYTYDAYSTISLTFLLILLLIYYRRQDKNNILINVILILLSGFSKETYLVSIIIFFAVNAVFLNKRRQDKIMVAISSLLAIFIIYFNKKIGSPFTSFSNNAQNPYYTNLQISSIIKTFIYYITDWGSIAVIILFIGIIIISIKDKTRILKIVMLFGMNMSAYLPYTVLPNHTVPHYRWLGIAFGYLGIFSLAERDFSIRNIRILKLFIAVSTIVTLWLNSTFTYDKYLWAIAPEKINNNILKGLNFITENIKPGDSILISGLYNNAETPFRSLYYLDDILPYKCKFSILTTLPSDSSYTNKYINKNKITKEQIEKFDKVFVYNADGKIESYIDLKNEKLTNKLFDEILRNDRINYDKTKLSLQEMLDLSNKYYYNFKDKDFAIQILNDALEVSDHKNPYPYSYIGKIYENEGNYDKAIEYYSKAVELGQQQIFIDSLNRVKGLKNK